MIACNDQENKQDDKAHVVQKTKETQNESRYNHPTPKGVGHDTGTEPCHLQRESRGVEACVDDQYDASCESR